MPPVCDERHRAFKYNYTGQFWQTHAKWAPVKTKGWQHKHKHMKMRISKNTLSTSDSEYITIIVSMGSVVLLPFYSDHRDLGVYMRALLKKKKKKTKKKRGTKESTMNRVNGFHRRMKWMREC